MAANLGRWGRFEMHTGNPRVESAAWRVCHLLQNPSQRYPRQQAAALLRLLYHDCDIALQAPIATRVKRIRFTWPRGEVFGRE